MEGVVALHLPAYNDQETPGGLGKDVYLKRKRPAGKLNGRSRGAVAVMLPASRALRYLFR